jgi:hypothetical protein
MNHAGSTRQWAWLCEGVVSRRSGLKEEEVKTILLQKHGQKSQNNPFTKAWTKESKQSFYKSMDKRVKTILLQKHDKRVKTILLQKHRRRSQNNSFTKASKKKSK